MEPYDCYIPLKCFQDTISMVTEKNYFFNFSWITNNLGLRAVHIFLELSFF